MSFFNLRKKKSAETKPPPAQALAKLHAVPEESAAFSARHARHDVLLRPRVTEKASASSARGAYVFEVSRSATKKDIKEAVRALYRVIPIKVTVVPIPSKRVVIKGRRGMKRGGRKAYVFLKEGDKIELV